MTLVSAEGKVIPQVKKIPLVAIGIPCGDRVHKEFAECLWGLGRGARNHRQGTVFAQSSIVAHGRNNCVAGMYEIEAEYLMQTDSDMIFPWNTIDRLLAHDKDIVGGTYVRRGPPFDNLGKTLNIADATKSTGLVEMTHLPTGMMLVKRRVFDAMTRPFFRYTTDESIGDVIGEDSTFSRMVRELGFSLWCDLDLTKELRHMYQYPLAPEDPASRNVAEKFKEAVNG